MRTLDIEIVTLHDRNEGSPWEVGTSPFLRRVNTKCSNVREKLRAPDWLRTSAFVM